MILIKKSMMLIKCKYYIIVWTSYIYLRIYIYSYHINHHSYFHLFGSGKDYTEHDDLI